MTTKMEKKTFGLGFGLAAWRRVLAGDDARTGTDGLVLVPCVVRGHGGRAGGVGVGEKERFRERYEKEIGQGALFGVCDGLLCCRFRAAAL